MSPDAQSVPPEDERELAAALYVFGLAEREELARAAAREATDPAFASAVAVWRDRMSELDGTAEPGRADEALWRRIEAALESAPATAAAPSAVPMRAADARPADPKAAALWFADAWRSLFVWRAAALAGAAAVLALALGVAGPRQAAPVMVAVLLTDANKAAAIVDVYADGRAELVPLESIAVPDDRALQVWTLWDRARGPVSLGLLDRARQIRLPVESLPRTVPDQLFEITLEPKAGSPTGRPTGPILMKGTTSRAL